MCTVRSTCTEIYNILTSDVHNSTFSIPHHFLLRYRKQLGIVHVYQLPLTENIKYK